MTGEGPTPPPGTPESELLCGFLRAGQRGSCFLQQERLTLGMGVEDSVTGRAGVLLPARGGSGEVLP